MNLFLDQWRYSFGIFMCLLTDKRPQFASKFLQSIRTQSDFKPLPPHGTINKLKNMRNALTNYCHSLETLLLGTPTQMEYVFAISYIGVLYTGTLEYEHITVQTRTKSTSTWSSTSTCKYECARRQFGCYVVPDDACKNTIVNYGFETKNQ